MARKIRYHLPGATYHVMLRGNDRQQIFFNDEDRSKMCLLIQEGIERFGYRVLAFCLMSNHVHLAIQVGQISLSRIIQNLSFRYTRYMNKKRSRIGHLFQGRFKSVMVDSSHYLNELVRYIHLNPVRAGIVNLPEQYQWSSHNAYLGKLDFTWIDREYFLSGFGVNINTAITKFESFVHSGIGATNKLDFKRGNQYGILGDDDFINTIKEKVKMEGRVATSHFSLLELVGHVCDFYEVDDKVLGRPGKDRCTSKIRSILALLVNESEGFTLEELGRIINREPSGLSRNGKLLVEKCRNSVDLQREICELKVHLDQMSECQA